MPETKEEIRIIMFPFVARLSVPPARQPSIGGQGQNPVVSACGKTIIDPDRQAKQLRQRDAVAAGWPEPGGERPRMTAFATKPAETGHRSGAGQR